MTTRTLLRAAALVLATTIGASAAQAQSLIKLGIAGGAAMPTSTTADAAKFGYNGTVALAVKAPLIPVGLRVDGMFNQLQGKESALVGGPKLNVIGVNANVTYSLLPLPLASVYVIGGAGYYQSKVEGFEAETDMGFNGGVGARIGVGRFQPFVEARYHRVNTGEDTKLEFIPITLGFMF
jgi:hypothetical protein